MPELPEVEVTRRSLAGPLLGARIHAVRLGKPLRWPLGCDPAVHVIGHTVGAIARRGKYLWMPLSTPAGASGGGLLLHLGMSGSLTLLQGDVAPVGRHD
ncbi:MAG: formamidopyrimidine-DNA glycosylase, partial [Rhodoferax sp.]|nr:formamidopyrimidine-DNA glycosylase [Rhodoferax sp.]